jgi:hypothetical protein
MDCYIVRVYRHITRGEGEADEIAGLVERVGQRDSSRPFSSYQSLVSAMREDDAAVVSGSADIEEGNEAAAAKLRLVQPAKRG